ncbi:MAG: PucR family transcriptional regulator [Sedimentibacter sp.]
MSVNFVGLCEFFTKKTKAVYMGSEANISFIDVELVTDKQTEFLENYIYVGNASMFNGKFDQINNSCIILVNDESTLLENFTDNKGAIIEINENENILEIYEEVRTFFRKDVKYNQFKILLLEGLLSGEGIYKIINIASKFIGNPLIAIDLSYKVLANSPIEKITDLLWIDNVKKGYCSYEFISELTKLESLKKGRKTSYPFEVTCPESPNKKVVFKIEVNGKIIGNIILIECAKKIDPNDYDYLMLISEIISMELEKKQFYRNTRNVLSEEILYDLLENNVKNKDIINERIKNGSLEFSSHIEVLVVDISNYDFKHSIYARYLDSKLANLFPRSKSIYYNGDVIIINDRKSFPEGLGGKEKIREFLLENKLKMGMSNEFSSLEDCSIYYHQAKKSLKTGDILEPEKCMYQYEDIQPYNFIYMAKEQIIKEDFYNDSLYMLKMYDDENSSELYKTLYIYLKNNHNITRTAEEMFIHRNTLRYRLEKIVDILGVDLDGNDISFKLYYAYKSMDFYKKIIEAQEKITV